MILHSLDDQATAEAEAQIARATKWQPEEVYDREWAALLLRQALDRLTQECALSGKGDLLSHLMPYLSTTEESAIPYEEMAKKRIGRSRHCAAMLPIAQTLPGHSTRSSARYGVCNRRCGRRTAIFVPSLGRALAELQSSFNAKKRRSTELLAKFSAISRRICQSTSVKIRITNR